MLKPWLFAAIAFTAIVTENPAIVSAETIEEVLAETYTTNPILKANRAQLRAADEAVPQALSNWRPTVSATGEVGKIWDESSTSTEGGYVNRTPASIGAFVVQPLYRGGRTVAQTRQAEATIQAERAMLENTEQTILLQAATAFLDVVRDEAVLELSISNERILERQLRDVQARFDVGEVTNTDVSQARARLSNANAVRVANEGILQTSRAVFTNLIGRPANVLTTPTEVVPVPALMDEAQILAAKYNPSVRATLWTAQASKESIDLIAGELRPNLSLNAGASRSLDGSVRDTSLNQTQISLQLNVPLYEGGEVYSRLRAQKQTYGQHLIESDQERRNAIQDATTGWENLLAARAQIQSFDSQIRASALALSGVQEEARVGTRTVLDVLNAEQELFDAKVNRVEALRDELVASYELRTAVGQMTARSLGLKVELYDPSLNYEQVRNQWIGSRIDQDYENSR